jgi:microcystin-dependent protein
MATSSSPEYIPVGSVFAYAGLQIPIGYLLCDGTAISSVTYWELFRAIGFVFSASVGVNFQVPDLVGSLVSGTNLVTGVTNPLIEPSVNVGFTLASANIPAFTCVSASTVAPFIPPSPIFSITSNGQVYTTADNTKQLNSSASGQELYNSNTRTTTDLDTTLGTWTPIYKYGQVATPVTASSTFSNISVSSIEMTYIIKAWSNSTGASSPPPQPQNLNVTILPRSTAINPLADNPNYSGLF